MPQVPLSGPDFMHRICPVKHSVVCLETLLRARNTMYGTPRLPGSRNTRRPCNCKSQNAPGADFRCRGAPWTLPLPPTPNKRGVGLGSLLTWTRFSEHVPTCTRFSKQNHNFGIGQDHSGHLSGPQSVRNQVLGPHFRRQICSEPLTDHL